MRYLYSYMNLCKTYRIQGCIYIKNLICVAEYNSRLAIIEGGHSLKGEEFEKVFKEKLI